MNSGSDQNITLREGLKRFYIEHRSHLSDQRDEIPIEVKAFFKSHDIAHVIFGCDISLFGEGSVKIWTIFGTTLGFWKHIRAYHKADAYSLSKKFTIQHVLSHIFKFLISIPTLIIRSKRMNNKWPWSDYDSYLGTSISEIREEFNIKVLRL